MSYLIFEVSRICANGYFIIINQRPLKVLLLHFPNFHFASINMIFVTNFMKKVPNFKPNFKTCRKVLLCTKISGSANP